MGNKESKSDGQASPQSPSQDDGRPLVQENEEEYSFSASPESLPESLPSVHEIEAASLRSENRLDCGQLRTKVVKLRSFVVKYGPDVTYAEGHTLLYLEQHQDVLPSLRFPRLYSMYTTGRMTYLIMEHLQGVPLSSPKRSNGHSDQSLWATYSTPDKKSISTILQRGMQELRSLPSAVEGWCCGVNGAPLPDMLSWCPDRKGILTGPFATEEDWNNAFLKILEARVTPHRLEFIRRCMKEILTGYQPIFSHGDLQRKNILVHKTSPDSDDAVSVFQVSIVDWESAGWYPAYWEYFVALWTCHQMHDDFGLHLDSMILDAYRVEFALCREILMSALEI